MKSDLEIATNIKLKHIKDVADKINLSEKDLEYYGPYKAKLTNYSNVSELKNLAKLVLVTATNPTPPGEGKTTTSIGLADALAKKHKVILALREPSLGPVFGVKGGAAGGGRAQVAPMIDINLHFTGDFHAISSSVNLLAAMLDNHIKQGNSLDINATTITLKRVVDMNDRQLRFIEDGLPGGAKEGVNGLPRHDGFEITVASEVMAVFCLAQNLQDLRKKLGDIIVAYSHAGKPVTAKDLKANGAMTALLKDALKPNLVQTLEHTPAIIHGGPFANIAHGCNSIIATKTALAVAGEEGYVVTEAGFGADLGAEKFIDIKCRLNNIYPDVIVLVTTIRALKYNGDGSLQAGLPNLTQHIGNLNGNFGSPVLVALNKFPQDTDSEIEVVHQACEKAGVSFEISEVHQKGGLGGLKLVEQIEQLVQQKKHVKFAYDTSLGILDKIRAIAIKIYHADDVILSDKAKAKLSQIELAGKNLPVCIAKTQTSFSDDPLKLGAPRGFKITITDLKLNAGAGFIVAYAGSIMTMPGLPASPAAEKIDVDQDGNVVGVF